MEPLISIRLDNPRKHYYSSDTLHCQYQVDRIDPALIHAMEVSVLWYTEGKGEEDLGIHYFERHVSGQQTPDLRTFKEFSVALPMSPLSYEGIIIKIQWCTRVRVFLRNGNEHVHDQPFLLGNIPVAEIIQP
jgi:hypothetical protein